MSTDNGYEINEMDFHLPDGQLGVKLGLDLTVTEVAPESPSHDRIRVGDRIITINGDLVQSSYTLQTLLTRHRPLMFIRVFRTRPGFDYVMTSIDYTRNIPFGLYLKDLNNKVFIGAVDPGSIAYMAGLRAGDHLVHVQGHAVTKKDIAKEYIVKYIMVSLAIGCS